VQIRKLTVRRPVVPRKRHQRPVTTMADSKAECRGQSSVVIEQ